MTQTLSKTNRPELEPADVRAFWRFMSERFHTRVIRKGSALEMRLVARALDALGIQDPELFLERFTTTLGRRIYVPFEVGVSTDPSELWDQIVLCVHEHQHVVQHDREGVRYELSYLASRAARARWEAEAYRSSLELHFWRYGTTPPAREVVASLRHYGLRAKDIDIATRALELSAVSVRQGAILNEATHAAIAWLDEFVPHLRVTPS